jgi:hypothetical protein
LVTVVTPNLAEVTERLKEELEGRQALLTIDYRTRLDVTSGLANLVQDYGPEEVGTYFLAG